MIDAVALHLAGQTSPGPGKAPFPLNGSLIFVNRGKLPAIRHLM
jgi:hypothetical protein